MGNCLVTKLKSVVDNSNLPKLDSLILQVTATATENTCGDYFIMNSNACKIITYGGYVGTSKPDLANQKTVLDIPANEHTAFFLSNGTYTVEITKKYTISRLGFIGGYSAICGPTSLDDIKYLKKLTIFALGASAVPEQPLGSITGKLSDLNLLTKMIHFNINGGKTVTGTPSDIIGMAGTLEQLNMGSCGNIRGDISEFGPFIHILSMDLYDARTSGTIESFIQGQCNSGRTSCESIFSPGLLRNGRTFGGLDDSNYFQTLSWESASKMCVYIGNSTGIPNAFKVYVRGYTDEEIAIKSASGGIWEGKTIQKVDA